MPLRYARLSTRLAQPMKAVRDVPRGQERGFSQHTYSSRKYRCPTKQFGRFQRWQLRISSVPIRIYVIQALLLAYT